MAILALPCPRSLRNLLPGSSTHKVRRWAAGYEFLRLCLWLLSQPMRF